MCLAMMMAIPPKDEDCCFHVDFGDWNNETKVQTREGNRSFPKWRAPVHPSRFWSRFGDVTLTSKHCALPLPYFSVSFFVSKIRDEGEVLSLHGCTLPVCTLGIAKSLYQKHFAEKQPSFYLGTVLDKVVVVTEPQRFVATRHVSPQPRRLDSSGDLACCCTSVKSYILGGINNHDGQGGSKINKQVQYISVSPWNSPAWDE